LAVLKDFTIGQLSRETGVGIETIRYYEKVRLLPKPPRTGGGHRLYANEQLKRLLFIRRSRELGFSMEEIRNLLGLVDGGYTCGQVKTAALDHLKAVRVKISDLRRMERTLAKNCRSLQRWKRTGMPNRGCPEQAAAGWAALILAVSLVSLASP
jgi:MerR family mercuric resistance operon transcriptional regulator